jgi:hypothetical protein
VQFDAFLRNQVAAASDQLQLAPSAMFPTEAPVYEWCLEQGSCSWVRWMATVPEYKCDVGKPFASLIVPTADSVRWVLLERSLVGNRHAFQGCTGLPRAMPQTAAGLGHMSVALVSTRPTNISG